MDHIITALIQHGYTEKDANAVTQKLSKMSPELLVALHHWISTGKENDISAEGYSTTSLKSRFAGMTYPAALLTIDWLKRNPTMAKQIIEKGIR